MAETYFASFLMLDETPDHSGGKRSAGDRNVEHGDVEISGTLSDILKVLDRAKTPGSWLERFAASGSGWDTVGADVALGRAVILQLKPGLGDGERRAVRTFLETLVRVSATLDESRLEAAIGKLADVLLPDDLADARGALASDNLAVRDRFVAEIPQFTSTEIGERAGLQTKNPYATAARWKKSGDIFSVQHRGKEFFPAFQFEEGRPRPVIRKLLATLPARLTSWQRAFWFVSSNGWLDDVAPADRLGDVDAVVAAAERESEEVVG